MRKKLLATILSIAMVASCIPMPTMAAGQEGGNPPATEEQGEGGSSNQQPGQDANNGDGAGQDVNNGNDEGTGQVQKVVQVGNQQYSSIEAALNKNPDAQEITLLGDVTLNKDYTVKNITVPATSTVTINGNGHTLTGVIENNGTLTLNNATITSEQAATIINKGTLTIEANAIVENTGNDGIALYAQGGTVTTNGTISGGKYGIYSMSETSVNLNVQTGKITGKTGIYWQNPGTLSTSDTNNGTEWNKFLVKGDDGPAIEVVCGNITISGGDISSKEAAAVKVLKNTSTHTLDFTINDGEFGNFDNTFTKNESLSVEEQDAASPSVKVLIKDGWFYNAVKATKPCTSITGGNFREDPSALLAENVKLEKRTGLDIEKPWLFWCKYRAHSGNEENVPDTPEAMKPSTNVAISKDADISDEDREAVGIAAAGVKTEGLEDKAQEVQIPEEQKNEAVEALKTQFSADKKIFSEEAQEKLNQYVQFQSTDSVEETIHVYAVPYLSVAPQSYKSGSSDINEAKYGLDIKPKYQVVASTADNVNQVVFGQEKDNNAVALQNSVSNLPVEEAEVMIPLPKGFAEKGTELYIKHTKDECSKNGEPIQYQYKCTVQEIAGVQYIEFDNKRGFSQFTLTKVPTTVASITNSEGVTHYYDNLESAINDVDNAGTIKLEKDIPDEVIIINGVKEFTIDQGEYRYDKNNISAGHNISLEVDGNKFISNYCPPEPVVPIDTVTVEAAANGQVSVDNKKAKEGEKVTVTTMPNENFVVDQVMVTKPGGESVLTTAQTVNQHHFIMPNSPVNVKVTFKAEQPPVIISFEDVPDDAWFAPAVQYVSNKGIMNGVSDTQFAPNIETNRAMIVTMLYRMENEPAVTASNHFVDVADGQWYTDAIRWASEAGIVSGYDASHFGPTDPITREQLSKILYGYAMSKGYGEAATISNIDRFDDATQINSWAKVSMEWANGLGLIQGISDTMISPQGKAVRAQVAAVLMRFCEDVAK